MVMYDLLFYIFVFECIFADQTRRIGHTAIKNTDIVDSGDGASKLWFTPVVNIGPETVVGSLTVDCPVFHNLLPRETQCNSRFGYNWIVINSFGNVKRIPWTHPYNCTTIKFIINFSFRLNNQNIHCVTVSSKC